MRFIGDDEMLVKGMECHSQRMASGEQSGYGRLPATWFCKESNKCHRYCRWKLTCNRCVSWSICWHDRCVVVSILDNCIERYLVHRLLFAIIQLHKRWNNNLVVRHTLICGSLKYSAHQWENELFKAKAKNKTASRRIENVLLLGLESSPKTFHVLFHQCIYYIRN